MKARVSLVGHQSTVIVDVIVYFNLAVTKFIVVRSSHLDSDWSIDSLGTTTIQSQTQILQRSFASIVSVVFRKNSTSSIEMIPNTSSVLSARIVGGWLSSGWNRWLCWCWRSSWDGNWRIGWCRNWRWGRNRLNSWSGRSTKNRKSWKHKQSRNRNIKHSPTYLAVMWSMRSLTNFICLPVW